MVQKGTATQTRVRVIGPDGTVYQRYILPSAGKYYAIPLQMGNGTYTVSIWQLVSGSTYRKILQTAVTVNFTTQYYQYPNIYANYTKSSAAVKKGFSLCQNAATDLDKVKAVYEFIIGTIKYDHPKAATVTGAYVPDPDEILSSKKGICFDYACLMATMLRSQGIPTKIVFGYVEGGFHAWNEVYIKTKGWIAVGLPSNGGWKRLDSTFGVSMSPNYLENDSNYSATEIY